MKETDLKSLLRGMARNAVRLEIGGEINAEIGRFGGRPDVPPGFVWPVFDTDTFDDTTVKPRPLSFLAQFDCAALAPLDLDGLLPHEGVLSFFYELYSQRWGFGPEDTGCSRVFWFPDQTVLCPAEFPAELDGFCRLPPLPIYGKPEPDHPDYDDAALALGKAEGELDLDAFEAVRFTLSGEKNTPSHKLLGWPDIIQTSMTMQCELVSRGHYLGGGWNIPEADLLAAEQTSLDGWRLLFQLDSGVQTEDFSLDFGDSGSIYFYIRKEDLAARRFDRVWLILQCC